MTDKKWAVPPELAPYEQYTNYPGRAEELVNTKATARNNIVLAAMACEAAAQWTLLARLRKAGLLLHPDDKGVLCDECKRLYEKGCPDCGACQAGCHSNGQPNPCGHPNAPWKEKAA